MSLLELFIYTLLFLILLCLFIIILGSSVYLISIIFELLFYFFKIVTILFVKQSYNLFCHLANFFTIAKLKLFFRNLYLVCIYRPFTYVKLLLFKCMSNRSSRNKIIPIDTSHSMKGNFIIVINPNNKYSLATVV